jgi:hypothetical protein
MDPDREIAGLAREGMSRRKGKGIGPFMVVEECLAAG